MRGRGWGGCTRRSPSGTGPGSFWGSTAGQLSLVSFCRSMSWITLQIRTRKFLFLQQWRKKVDISYFKLSINYTNLIFQLEPKNYGILILAYIKYFYISVLSWELLCRTLIIPIVRSGYPLWALLFWGPMLNHLLIVIPPGYDNHAEYWI